MNAVIRAVKGGLMVPALLLFAGKAWGATTGTIQDVQHVVIFLQENRSFDE